MCKRASVTICLYVRVSGARGFAGLRVLVAVVCLILLVGVGCLWVPEEKSV